MNFRTKMEEMYKKNKYDVPDSAFADFAENTIWQNWHQIPPLYRYSPTDYYNIRALEKDELFLSELGKMNDIFEGLSGSLESWFVEDFTEICDIAYVKSFTEQGNDLKMWSQYADNYAGMCVRYDVHPCDYADNDFLYHLFPVIYSDKKLPSDRFTKAVKNMKYIKWNFQEDGDADFSDINGIMEFCLQKSRIWENEKEWRILITYSQLNSDADTADDHENQLLYPDFSHRSILFPFAKEVFIGPKTPKYIENHILEICQKKEQEIDVYRMKLSKASHELERKKLN